ncbi:MAG TPA: hypothetical protein VM911_14700 [Pyrinomonadaceae bacterium]|jgi:hypothetical protein|nr:hypothetical protein [Pyrinomonadaceae bacterium]
MMTRLTGRRAALWVAFLALIVAIAVPSVAYGQGRGRGRGRQKDKCDKFVNCHDASDGRVDGRGPRRDDRYDDDDRYDNDDRDDDDYDRNRNRSRGRNRRDRDDDGVFDRNDLRQRALDVGYREGFRAGRDDNRNGRSFDYDDHDTYRDATAGYRNSYGDREVYRRYFQEGYRRGYDDGYRNRNAGGTGGRSRVGEIIGDILGRP